MKSRIALGSLLLAVLAAGAVSAVEPNVGGRHLGIAFFIRPTHVAGKVILGKTLIVHDDARMARGEACTTIYRYHGTGTEELVSFMCKPQARAATDKMTVRCVRNYSNLTTDIMTEYQFPGETEAHAVPVR